MSIADAIDAHEPAIRALRHRLHRIPELGYEEFKTAALIREELDRLGIAHIDGVENAPTATIVLIGEASKPCLALRADIDALPILEQTGLPYASTHPGRMHACGHDGHAAMLLGTAAILKSLENELPVCVKLLFQPAEEGGAGARRLVEAGVLDGRLGPKVSAIFGLHGWPGVKVGTVATRPGPILAATDNFTAKFVGAGCHGAYPHLGADPIAAAAEAVLSLQQIVAREVNPTDSAVVTVGQFHGGTAANVIPPEATIHGTARTLAPAVRQAVHAAIERRCRAAAAAGRCTLDFSWHEGYPPTVNDPAMAGYVAQVARQTLGEAHYQLLPTPTMGGEDFSYYLEQIPGCFIRVGVDPPGCDRYPSLHNDHYDFTDEALAVGVKLFVGLVRGWKESGQSAVGSRQ